LTTESLQQKSEHQAREVAESHHRYKQERDVAPAKAELHLSEIRMTPVMLDRSTKKFTDSISTTAEGRRQSQRFAFKPKNSLLVGDKQITVRRVAIFVDGLPLR
jgi:hypothetical protein